MDVEAEAKRHARRRAANNRYRLTPVFYLRAEGCWTFNGTAPAAGPGMVARIHETISHLLRSKYLVLMTLSAILLETVSTFYSFLFTVRSYSRFTQLYCGQVFSTISYRVGVAKLNGANVVSFVVVKHVRFRKF